MTGQRSNQLNYVPNRGINDLAQNLANKAFARSAYSALAAEEHVPEAAAAYQAQSHCTPRKDAEYSGWKSRPGLCWQMAIAQSRHEKEIQVCY
jgi:hypothetical protein